MCYKYMCTFDIINFCILSFNEATYVVLLEREEYNMLPAIWKRVDLK